MQQETPLNPIPPVVLLAVLAMIAVEVVLGLAAQGIVGGQQGIGWRIRAWEDYAFAPRVVELVAERGVWSADLLARFVTYPFVHASVTHAAFAVVITLAMGKFAGEVLTGFALGALMLACTVLSALFYGLVVSDNVPLFGAYPLAYGLIGAYTYILWLHLGRRGERQIAAFRLIGFLFVLQIVYAMLFGSNPQWIAELAGFVIGFALTPLLVPGGWTALLMKLRTR
ncbi:rhomboid family intramembrane serine protease [Oceanicola granulosus]|uniref:rhomboid family intramembrane serine protease n=1 Tax=Oceanicola granulosus TaxID=252302 RepID=UPI00058AF6A2|nr:rhomboid family intramembrane serine protease [Oceanicola granulosus]